MANQSYASLIDFASSWANIGIAITPYGSTTLDTSDISSISHSGTVEVGEQKGSSGGRVMSTTTGSVKYEGSITFYRSGLRKMLEALVEAAPDYAKRGNQVRISLVKFDLDIQHSPPGVVQPFHTRMKGCRLLGYSDDMTEGDDADMIELPLHVLEVANILNGQEVVLL